MKATIIIAAILFASAYSYAQNISVSQLADPDAAMSAKIEAAIATLHLDTLQGKIMALYSKGYQVRAKAIQTMVENCVSFYKSEFPNIKFDLRIMILDKEEWHKIHLDEYGSDYGMPTAWFRINRLFIAADKKAVGELFGEQDNLPDNTLSEFDCIALHELGHIFLKRYNHTHTQKKWADEFLASYFAICFFEQHTNYPGLPQVGETGYTPKYRTLADFERLYSNVGARNYGWYQGQFQNLGYKLYPKFKTQLIKIFIDNFSDAGKKLPPLDLLKQIAPDITNQWLNKMEK
jgi:hypothetical protein